MKYLFVLFIFVVSISFPSLSTSYNSLSDRQERVIVNLFDQLVKKQVNPSLAIERSVNALLKSYPEQIDIVLKVALRKYPQKYKQIMCGALRAEPALASDVISILMKSNISTSSDIVSIALHEEPAYAKEIVNIALAHSPEQLDTIVKVALVTEPVMASSVVNNTMESYPERILDILVIAITTLPNEVMNIVKNTLKLSADSSDVISTAISSSTGEQARDIITAAVHSGMSYESATAAAIAGGAKPADIVNINP